MKFQVEIDIDLPRAAVVAYYRDARNLRHWLDGFQKFEYLSDETCQVGSRFKVSFSVGNMNIGVEETITRNDLPEEIWYEEVSEGISNIQKNLFIDLEENKTKWVIISNYESEYMKYIGLSAFKKKTVKFMESFKKFVESKEFA